MSWLIYAAAERALIRLVGGLTTTADTGTD